ncbi:MAG: FAD-binding oxidoreductase [Aigarchaeota archaeon]|nr:FAD-binding oxidoreductase [Aigarchaeota archaeon]
MDPGEGTRSVDRLKWWGWGEEGKSYPLDDRPNAWPFLNQILGLSGSERSPRLTLDQIKLRKSRADERLIIELQRIVGKENVSTETRERLVHSMGKGYQDLIRVRRGIVQSPPDIVVYPASEGQVATILECASQRDASVIPFGGGTSVVGGVEARPREEGGLLLSLDMTRMNRVLAMDPVSLTAKVESGIMGPDLEEKLNQAGYTLGHFPESFEYSTLGGWIAARAAGQKSTRYGKIEHMVEGLRLISPTGTIATRDVPASAAGPNLKQFLIGSEGIFGVLTEVTLRIHRYPDRIEHRGLLLRDFSSGIGVLREILQAGVNPPTLRLSDSPETRAYAALLRRPRKMTGRLKTRLGMWLMKRRGFSLQSSSLLIVGLEGSEAQVAEQRRIVLAKCREAGAFNLGRGAGEAWYRDRFELPYLRDVLLDRGVMVDTLETATTWRNLENLYLRVKEAIEEAIASMGVKPYVMCHVSHLYKDGASLYYTFLAKQVEGREMEQWREVKKASCQCILENGGTLSHHHGVGLEHAAWMEGEVGRKGKELISAVKSTLDPRGIMNPGKILGTTPEWRDP